MNCKSGFAKEGLEIYEVDGVKYRKSNKRMIYDPEFHDAYGQRWTDEELSYIAKMRPAMKWIDISLALGRTHETCAGKYYKMKKEGKLEYYKNLDI